MNLIELAERCEAAAGPNFALEADIATAVGWNSSERRVRTIPNYTASIDAALVLVPEGWAFFLDSNAPASTVYRPSLSHSRQTKAHGAAATPALALAAAALRARACGDGGTPMTTDLKSLLDQVPGVVEKLKRTHSKGLLKGYQINPNGLKAADIITALAEHAKKLEANAKSDWFAGEVDCDGNELTTIRADDLQKLKDEREKFMWQVRDTCTRAEKLEAENERQAKALGFYADPANWIDTPSWDGDPDCVTPKAIPVFINVCGRRTSYLPCECEFCSKFRRADRAE